MSENSRFQHLLQPIRDLSKNWNIDLAQELEEYMDQLDNLAIRFDPEDEEASAASFGSQTEGDDAKVMNFAEAALLIQGTSAIYSRKVEYLHALVFQTLGHLSKQQEDDKQRQAAQQSGEGGEDDEDDDGSGANLFANPLPLYDDLDEAKPTHITLKRMPSQLDQEESDESVDLRAQPRRGDAAQLTKSKHNLQASIALMGSLVPDEREHGETFKLLSCNMHVSGVLLLDEASKKYLGEQQRAAGDQPLAFGETPGRHGAQWRASDGSDPAAALNFDHMDVADDDAGLDGAENEPDYDFDGGEQAPEAPEHAEAAESHPEGSSSRRLTRVPLAADAKDPWTPLDAYDASSSVARPFRKGRSYPKVPAYKKKKAQSKAQLSNKDGVVGQEDDALEGLEDPTFQARFLAKPQWASWVWTETASENAVEKTCKRVFCRAPLLAKNCDALWARERKWRSVMRRCQAREQQSAQAMLLREQAAEEDEADALTLHGASARLDLAFRSNALDADEAEQEDEDDGNFDAGFDGADWDQAGELDDATGAFSAEAMARTASDGPLSYEEICRQHLASFMSGTEKYVRETDLSKQVSDWQSKLAPLLKEQDAHPPFDIQHYGREIMDRLEDQQPDASNKSPPAKRARRTEEPTDEPNGQAVPFETLVDGKQQFEVCRLFLASLQLANSGNVALSHAHSTADHGRVPFRMQLLTTTNAYESLQA